MDFLWTLDGFDHIGSGLQAAQPMCWHGEKTLQLSELPPLWAGTYVASIEEGSFSFSWPHGWLAALPVGLCQEPLEPCRVFT